MKTILLALLLATVSAPAIAAPAITQTGADALKKQAQEVLAYHASTLKSAGMTLQQQGEVVVEPAQTYYALTTPNLVVKMPQGITRTIGMVAINAIPTDNPKVYKMAVALPTPVIDTNSTGATVGSISIGQQSMSGLYNFDVRNFTELNGTYKDINVTQPNGVSASIPELTTQTKLEDRGQGLWSGPFVTTMKNSSYKDATGEYGADTFELKANFDQIDLLGANVFRAQLQQAMTNPTGDVAGVVTNYLSGFASGADLSLITTGSKYKTTKAGQTTSGSIASSSVTANLKDIKTDKANISWNSAMEGIKTDDANMAQYTPTRSIMRANATGVPYKKLLAQSDTKKDFVAILKDSSTKLVIDQMVLDAPAFGLDSKGNVSANPAAPMGVVGDVAMTVRGVDGLLKWMSDPKGAQAVGIPAIPAEYMAIVSMAQLTGKPGTDTQGRPVLTYNVSMGADGSLIMNGTPLMPAAMPKK